MEYLNLKGLWRHLLLCSRMINQVCCVVARPSEPWKFLQNTFWLDRACQTLSKVCLKPHYQHFMKAYATCSRSIVSSLNFLRKKKKIDSLDQDLTIRYHTEGLVVELRQVVGYRLSENRKENNASISHFSELLDTTTLFLDMMMMGLNPEKYSYASNY